MANDEHVVLLKQGAKVWNEWRQKEPNVTPDISNADLRNANLRDVFLARLELLGANFTGADLTNAILGMANLAFAVLAGAHLRRANLIGANLTAADLQGAHVHDVMLGETVFGNTNLRDVQGLETCQHVAPSTIDHRTLIKSGELPSIFLRRCGLPDQLIDSLPSLLNKAIQFYSCFISHSSKDGDFSKRLHADLQEKGVRCWFAPEDLKIGDPFRSRIEDSIRIHDKLLLVLSEQSLASAWVENEVESALDREGREKRTVLFPIRLDDAVMETQTPWVLAIRRTRHIGDFTKWKSHDDYTKAFEGLLKDLKASPQ